MTDISRRSLLQLTGGALGAAALASTPATTAHAASSQWPGHKPGRIYLGFSAQYFSTSLRRTGPVGLYRTYYRWSWSEGERRRIASDHAADRIPWVSFKPPGEGRSTWRAIASGRYDAEIRRRARGYASVKKPVIVTFNHEPQNDDPNYGADFSRAWCHIHDVMKRETNLENVVSVPIIGEWTFNPINRRMDHRDWVTPQMLNRCHFLGIDLYQNNTGDGYDERLGRVMDHMARLGHSRKMVGLGETGARNGWSVPGATWWREQWNWAARNTDKIGAISYFNSQRNTNLGGNWLLWETNAKLAEYRRGLSSWRSTTL
ncbi:MAG: hypothetical protein WBG76_06545 [Ornithinimicrobium sp.]